MKAIIWIFIAISLVASVYHFGGQSLDSITGFVVSENSLDEYGEYYYKPDFRIPLTSEPEIYDKLRQTARTLVLTSLNCEETKNLEDCIDSLKKPAWSIDCDTNEERIFTDIAEKYMQCANSIDNYCLCELELGTYAEGDYSIIIEDNTDGTHFSLGKHEHQFDMVHPGIDTNIDGTIIRGDTGEKYEIKLEYDEEFIGTDIELDGLIVSVFKDEKLISEHEFEDRLYYFKIDDQMILVPVDEYNLARAEAAAKPGIELRNCWLPNKRIYKFCVDSGKTLHVKDKEVSDHELIYRFAMDFSDNEPPQQTQMHSVSNIDNTKESLLVTWQDSTATDFDHYMLFVSKDEIKDITGMQPAAFLTENKYVLREYPEKDNLLRIEDGITYYVTVVPVDKSNNHITQITYQMSGRSEDNVILH